MQMQGLLDQQKMCSQTRYVFIYNNTAISRCSTKYKLVLPFSNRSKILTFTKLIESVYDYDQ